MVDLGFECLGVTPHRGAANPTMQFRLRVTETTGTTVHAMMLRCQIRIDPRLRRYGDDETRLLAYLFGDMSTRSLNPVQFGDVSVAVPRFTGSTELDLPVPVSYDLEVAAGTYLHSVREGVVPMNLLFSGTVFSLSPARDGSPGGAGLVAEPVPWHLEAHCRMPVSTWRELMDAYFPASGWLRVGRDTVDALQRYKLANAVPTWDAALAGLLAAAPAEPRPPSPVQPPPVQPPPDPAPSGQDHGAGVSDSARAVADAVLYEGALLYPYRADATKNQLRWQFGVLFPPSYAALGTGEHDTAQAEMLLDHVHLDPVPTYHGADSTETGGKVEVRVRFLRLVERGVERRGPDGEFEPVPSLTVGGEHLVPWDEAAEREIVATVQLADLLDGDDHPEQPEHPGRPERVVALRTPAARDVDLVGPDPDDSDPAVPRGRPAGRVVRDRRALRGELRLSAERLPGPYGALRLRAVLANTTGWRPAAADGGTGGEDPNAAAGGAGAAGRRAEALRHSLVAAHLVVSVRGGGRFLSLADPPAWAAEYAQGCVNERLWPALLGRPEQRDAVLAAPIILPDHPEVAPESPGNFFDATEMDEMLTLRTATLTDAEKTLARATDGRCAELFDLVDGMPAELVERLHGAARSLDGRATGPATPATSATSATTGAPASAAPWWDPGADASVRPESDSVVVAGRRVAAGTEVLLRPSRGRGDAQDMFLDGRRATVAAVFTDVDDQAHVAVTLDEDPAAELSAAHGRFRYFSPDELWPVGPASAPVRTSRPDGAA